MMLNHSKWIHHTCTVSEFLNSIVINLLSARLSHAVRTYRACDPASFRAILDDIISMYNGNGFWLARPAVNLTGLEAKFIQ